MIIQNLKFKIQKFKLKFKTFYFLFVFLPFAFCLLPLNEVQAQEFSTGVNPSVIKIEASSPSTVNSVINIENSSDQTITYGIFLRPFKAGSDLNGEPNYDPKLYEEYNDFFKNVTILDQGQAATQITLSPHQKKDLSLRIQVTEDLEPRDYYFTVVLLSQQDQSEAKSNIIKIRGGLGTNILLSIGNKKEPQGRISKFTAPGFITHGPLEFGLEIANLNDYFISPKGNLIIRNMFGQAVGNIELENINILANSNRLISNSEQGQNSKLLWNEEFLFGVYKADLSVALTDKGPLLTESRLIIAMPVKETILSIILISIFTWLFKAARRKNQSI